MTSRFHENTQVQATEVGRLREAFFNDTFDKKVDLIVGAYRDDEGKPWLPTAVRLAETEIQQEGPQHHQYMRSLGDQAFRQLTVELVLGPDSPAIRENRVVCAQAIGGTGALRMGAVYLSQILKYTTVYFSAPTWNNHEPVFLSSGFSNALYYRYWDSSTLEVDFQGMLEDLRRVPHGSLVMLQTCAQNPTGCDLSEEQWRHVADVVEERNLLPFLDCAYHGLVSGDLDKDAWPVRYFVERGFELLYSHCFSKNMGLYDARLGCLMVVTKDSSNCINIACRLENIEFASYLTLPSYGASIAVRVMQNKELRAQWKQDIKKMASRIRRVRKELRQCLEEMGTPGTWKHITEQAGMFSYTGMSPEAARYMVQDYHVYMLESGRMNVCAITRDNLQYVARAIYNSIKRSSCNGSANADHKLTNGTAHTDKPTKNLPALTTTNEVDLKCGMENVKSKTPGGSE